MRSNYKKLELNLIFNCRIKLKKRDMQCPVCQNTHLRFLEYKQKDYPFNLYKSTL